ncbi:putative Ig domain-containing protein [Neolewinella antarctica]|uniref:CBM6 domain-containing protein n=1 Tax=Neolewinella antarctica TaxID=442734 RepID=A0ABX0X9E7_9BACT|nr:putative Ig domain-containing protein [Neolewinella antarctica]NJC25891.1 hypothetical protein [Neolewinella antarctica]
MGDKLTVVMRVAAGPQEIDGIQAFLDFNPAFITIDSVVYNATTELNVMLLDPGNFDPLGNIDGASARLSGFATGPFDYLTIDLTAKAAGTTSIDFSFGPGPANPVTRITRGGDLVLGTTTGATITINGTNAPPVFNNTIADQVSTENDIISLDASADDPDDDVITYVATGLPSGLSIDGTTGIISGTITSGALASSPFAVTVTATDDGSPAPLSEQISFNWVVEGLVNNPPAIEAITDVVANEGDLISVNIKVTDDNLPSATLQIFDKSNGGTNPFMPSTAITGYTFTDNGNGNYVLSWSPLAGAGRSYRAVVTADDGSNTEVTQSFSIDVAQQIPGTILSRTFSNPFPWYGSSPPGAGFSVAIEDNTAKNIGYIDGGDFVEYWVNVPVAGDYEWRFSGAKGNGGITTVTLSEDNGGFSTIGSVNVPNDGWQNYDDFLTNVNFTNAGLQKIRLDFNGGCNSDEFEFTPLTTAVNTPPVITVAGANPLNITEGDVFANPGATATDAEDGDLTAAIQVSGTVDANTPGSYFITYTVTDSNPTNPLSDTEILEVIVNGGVAADCSDIGAVDLNNDGEINSLDTDDDGDGVTDELDIFALDAANGTTQTLPINLSFDAEITNTLLCSGFTGIQSNGVTNYLDQFNSNNITVDNGAGTLTINLTSADAGDVFKTQNNANNGFQLGFTVPAGAYTIHGQLENPFPAGFTGNQYQSAGIQVGDGTQANFMKFVLGVQGNNVRAQRASEVNDVPSEDNFVNTAAIEAASLVDLYIDVDAAGMATPRYELDGVPVGAAFSPYDISGFIANGVLAVGIISTTTTGSSSTTNGNPFTATWKILEVNEETPANGAPGITTISDQISTEGDVISLQTTASDPDAGNILAYTATGLPAGIIIDQSGLISGTITVGAASVTPYSVTVTVTDDGTPTLNAATTFSWTVSEPVIVNTAPVVTIDSPVDGSAVPRGTNITLSGTVTDAEENNLETGLQWSSSDTQFTPDAVSGGVGASITGQLVTPGSQTITATVVDGGNLSGSDVVTVTVSGPQVDLTSPLDNATVTSTDVQIEWTATEVLYGRQEHFHLYVNPQDLNNLDTDDRISTASAIEQTFWDLTDADGITAGTNTVVIRIADQFHEEFLSNPNDPTSYINDVVTFTVDETIPVELPEPCANTLYRVNVGGPAQASADTTSLGWSSDVGNFMSAGNSPFLAAMSGGGSIYSGNAGSAHGGPIIMTDPTVPTSAPAAVFNTERYDGTSNPEMKWEFPVTPGTEVQITLLFAELFGGINQVGDRVFDVTIEGIVLPAFDDIDPFAIAGAKGAFTRSATITVMDGTLDIEFIHGIENPALKGIQICNLSDGAILPVELVSFLGRTGKKQNTLEWISASEEAFNYYELERLPEDASGWEVVGAVAGAGQVGEVRTYTYHDVAPPQSAYYRLRMVDLDDSFTYSDVVYLKRGIAAGELVVYPNPSDGEFTIQLPTDESTILTLYDLNGRVVWQRKATSTTTSLLQSKGSPDGTESNLAEGVYLLSAKTDSDHWTKRVIVR